MSRSSALLVLSAALAVGTAPACGSKSTPGVDGAAPDGDAASDAGDVEFRDVGSAPERSDGPREASYEAPDGGCTPGVPRCQGDFGYRMCEQDGTWSEAHSCAGYSSNGTTSYCADIPQDTGEPWATCIDPACWYWMGHDAPPGASAVGICEPDGTMRKCSAGGTLSPAACDGVCTRVATLDARRLGYCAPASACQDGARECLGGPFYRVCAKGRWEAPVACDGECNPVGTGARPDIRCGGACDPGTSRCRPDLAAVELCSAQGAWVIDKTCALGMCRSTGPQAQCEAECSDGQRACAFDGAYVERRCDARGHWAAETSCTTSSTCRMSGDIALGCVACVPARVGGGNAFDTADSRCSPGTAEASGVEVCGEGGVWQAKVACPAGKRCVQINRGSSSVAGCQLP